MPDASAIRDNPKFVAWLMITASRFRLSSRDRGVAPPVWVKQSRNPVRRSSSMSTDTIGAKGSSAVSSALRLGDFGGHVLSRQRPDDQLAVLIDPDRSLPASQDVLELTEGGVQLGVPVRNESSGAK